jgi:cytochrome oxidase Cu insertion factor (SCO1/SenC/PrrC family)
MRSYELILFCLIAIIMAVFALSVEARSGEVDNELGFPTGPAVGQTVPIFSLPDQNGKIVSLKELVGKKGAILNFFRSASW